MEKESPHAMVCYLQLFPKKVLKNTHFIGSCLLTGLQTCEGEVTRGLLENLDSARRYNMLYLSLHLAFYVMCKQLVSCNSYSHSLTLGVLWH